MCADALVRRRRSAMKVAGFGPSGPDVCVLDPFDRN